jgi:rare lipoprotein A
VTNLQNGRAVDVRINDRGPFKKGRMIDLSKAAAREIDLIEAGIGKVELRILSFPSS